MRPSEDSFQVVIWDIEACAQARYAWREAEQG